LRSIILWSRRGFAVSGVYDLAPIRDTLLNIALKLTNEDRYAFATATGDCAKAAHDRLRRGRIAGPGAGLEEVLRRTQGRRRARRTRRHWGADHFTILEELRRTARALAKVALSLASKPR
jgi:arylformamidase